MKEKRILVIGFEQFRKSRDWLVEYEELRLTEYIFPLLTQRSQIVFKSFSIINIDTGGNKSDTKHSKAKL